MTDAIESNKYIEDFFAGGYSEDDYHFRNLRVSAQKFWTKTVCLYTALLSPGYSPRLCKTFFLPIDLVRLCADYIGNVDRLFS
jgi:hypothetical protein